MRSSVAVRRRKSWLLAASALASSSLGVSEPALALDECGPSPATCSPLLNPYATGINYTGSETTPLSVTLQSGVNVTIPAVSPGVNAVNLANSGGVTAGAADITITANGTPANPIIINNANNPTGLNQTGLRIQSSGSANIMATNTTIDVNGTASDWAILAFAMPNQTGVSHVTSVNWSGQRVTNLSAGVESGAIQADHRGTGNASVVASGNVNVVAGAAGVGSTQYGLLAHAGDPTISGVLGAGDASVTFNSGTITVDAARPRGILAWVDGIGSVTVNTGANTVINVSGTQFGGPGVYLFASGTATAPNTLTANVASQITSVGPATINLSNPPVGIRATNSGTGAPIFVNYTGPGITTVGGGGAGILTFSGSGSINVSSTGPITTNGSAARGVVADSGGGPITVAASGAITTQGPESHGIWATSTTGTVQVNATNVSTPGQFSTGINATSGGGVTVNIPQGASVVGGWQADLTSVGPTFGLPSAGVILSSTGGTATLTNDGSIGALSDRAVAGDPVVINNGAHYRLRAIHRRR
jgi:hypothetical protein